ncbi:MAG: phosphatidate cytidylyltransferase [Acidobacteria bacterium]|nr:phosphatidate cytidylyltransferase [Acidobacteriota bacterium]
MTRLLSGVALGAAALAAILFLPQLGLRLLACLVAVVAAREYLRVLHQDGRRPRALPVLLLVVLTCWWMSSPAAGDLLVLLLVGLGWLAVEVLFRGLTVDRAAARFLAPWYIGMPLGMLAAVQAIGGRMATLLLIATVVVSDSAQYYTGRVLGRRPLAPAISPKKTIEGAAGGALLATLFLALAGPRVLPPASPVSLALLGLAIAALGICGDLFESRLKRIAGVKDSAALIPGHGGILDRIDALLFATPAFYLYMQRWVVGG